MNEDKKMYGFFSQKAYDLGYGSIWIKPNGDQVTVTFVGDTPEVPDTYKWKDTLPVGEVTKHFKCLDDYPRFKLFQKKK